MNHKRQCPICGGDGWYVCADINTGDAIQVQCANCYGTGQVETSSEMGAPFDEPLES